MNYVRAKRNLGQHFLKDKNIAQKIVDSLRTESTNMVLEIGPGMGVLTQFLLQRNNIRLKVIEIDHESVSYLEQHYPALANNIIEGDFLGIDLFTVTPEKFSIIGNFPYNISSQIFFRVLGHKNYIPEVVGMVQKEVAERLCSAHGNKTYGILSVLLQAFYDIEYLFTVPEQVFVPAPRVKSAVIRLTRNNVGRLGCDEELFFRVVKTAFNQRRKMLRNSLKQVTPEVPEGFQQLRPEQLSVQQFISLTRQIESRQKK
ncbi:SSU rRNA (adenine(1518)-N(6)/adenine(1519)-N(6))-dimethyltransferase [hydrothermal vent metagenome]|uniref:SSU rRNA (Adenine(1518)-N(6)/adenine(1519)-N(6))-dimethyltransferase n=1 Tax=hydrothermal vent metagenome TaxID=652676 RepID=A0A3B0U0H4_9ZZZZ